MNGDTPRSFAPPRTSSRIALIPSGSAERRPVRSSTSSPSIESQVLRNSHTPSPERRPATLTMVFESSDVVSIRTVMRIPYSKYGATLDTRRVRLSNPFDRNLLDLRLVWNTRKSLVIRPIYRPTKPVFRPQWLIFRPNWRTLPGGSKNIEVLPLGPRTHGSARGCPGRGNRRGRG